MSKQDPIELKSLGNTYLKSGDYTKATESYTSALSIANDDKALTFLLYSNRSYSNILLGYFSDAFNDACKAIETDPTHYKGYLRRSNVLAEYSFIDQSIEDIKTAIKLASNEADKKSLKDRLIYLENIKKENEDQEKITPKTQFFPVIHFKKDNKKPDFFKEKLCFFTELTSPDINLETAKKYGEYFFDRKGLNKKSADLILSKLKVIFNSDYQNTTNNILRINASKVTVLGNINGDIGKMYSFFDTNGYPSKENVYLINGNFIGSNDFRIIFILFLFKLAEPSSIYFTLGAYDLSFKKYGSCKTPDFVRIAKASLENGYGPSFAKSIFEIIEKFPLCIIVNDKFCVVNGGPPLDSNSVWGQFSLNASSSNELSSEFPMFSFGEKEINQFLNENNCDCMICSNRNLSNNNKGYETLMDGKFVNVSFDKKEIGYAVINDTRVDPYTFKFDMFPLKVEYKEKVPFYKGIFYQMRKYLNNSPDQLGLIEISSIFSNLNEANYTIDSSFTDFDFMTWPVNNPFVLFDFKERKIQLENYSIESSKINPFNDHMKTWKVEGSNDLNNWTLIDDRKDVNELNGPLFRKVFEVKHKEFYRYIKLVQTERNHRGNLNLAFHHIEFFGIVE